MWYITLLGVKIKNLIIIIDPVIARRRYKSTSSRCFFTSVKYQLAMSKCRSELTASARPDYMCVLHVCTTTLHISL